MYRSLALLTVGLILIVGGLSAAPAPAFALVAEDRPIADAPADQRPVLPAHLTPTKDKKLYLALGDSFSSGEGAPAHVFAKGGLLGLGTDRYKLFLGDPLDDGYACHRSPHAYPATVATALGPDWGLDFRACSGAVLDDLDESQYGEPPQLDVLAHGQPDLITMTMGGNDLQFSEIVKACLAEAAFFSHAGPNDCRTREGNFVTMLADLRPRLTERYGVLHQTLAPGGRLVVFGYPRLFPVVPPGRCGAGVGPGGISEANMRWVNSVSERLSAAIRSAAIDVGATYVDVTNLLGTDVQTRESDRHDACIDEDDRRWINRTILDTANDPLARNWSWHPKVAAHGRMADLVGSCMRDPMTCDSPELRRVAPPRTTPPQPCGPGCDDLTISDRWTGIGAGPLRADSPGMTPSLFRALYPEECDLDRGGPGLGVTIEQVETGDLTGDGWEEAAFAVECVGPTSGWPEHVLVLDGYAGPGNATVLGGEITDGRLPGSSAHPPATLENVRFVFGDGLTVTAGARSTDVPNAESADFAYREEFFWNGTAWLGATTNAAEPNEASDLEDWVDTAVARACRTPLPVPSRQDQASAADLLAVAQALVRTLTENPAPPVAGGDEFWREYRQAAQDFATVLAVLADPAPEEGFADAEYYLGEFNRVALALERQHPEAAGALRQVDPYCR